ncbi:hypothetical protein ACFOU2_16910 [Bacillus songklensis]|uniref:Uncharacterized protein n=1 Tax=Bacillus songklensis TaxID=1069116 RepID=A0ABV8B576_9BACI
MNKNQLFLEELKYVVENGFILNEYLVEQLQKKLGRSSSLIIEIYQIFVENRHILPFIDDIETIVYDYIICREMTRAKTFYGATMFAADMFETTQTYIKCKVDQYRQSSYLKISA